MLDSNIPLRFEVEDDELLEKGLDLGGDSNTLIFKIHTVAVSPSKKKIVKSKDFHLVEVKGIDVIQYFESEDNLGLFLDDHDI